MDVPEGSYENISFGDNILLVTPSFWNLVRRNPLIIKRILNPATNEKHPIEGFSVYFTTISGEARGPLDIYVKTVSFVDEMPIRNGDLPGNKAPEREFFNYLRLREIKKSFSKYQREAVDIAEPLFCFHDLTRKQSHIVTRGVRGTITLDALLNLRRMRPDLKVEAVQSAERALRVMHKKGVIYTDVNPGNILISRVSKGRATLIDPEYILFREDDSFQERIRETGKGYDERCEEEISLLHRYTDYRSLALEAELSQI